MLTEQATIHVTYPNREYSVSYSVVASTPSRCSLIIDIRRDGEAVDLGDLAKPEKEMISAVMTAAGWGEGAISSLYAVSEFIEQREHTATLRYNRSFRNPAYVAALDYLFGPQDQDNEQARGEYGNRLQDAALTLCGSSRFGSINLFYFAHNPAAMAFLGLFIQPD
jgi:hypothetical protein